ncbi:hypothetical protein DH2020_015613 [Rehmannia glutinosa]|uniref:40S ribosomal protein S5 n=1 Tax=Rehmannia glutinosa TaxID=99300 RepID=A0ABR0WTQ3_REHGL
MGTTPLKKDIIVFIISTPPQATGEVVAVVPEGEKVQTDVMLFNRWSYDEVRISDISVEDYITATGAKHPHPTYTPHTAGRYQAKRFRKAQCPIVERLTNSPMMHGRNNGKKLKEVRIIKHAMEIIHLLRRVNQAIYLLSQPVPMKVLSGNIKTIVECAGDELINATKGSSNLTMLSKRKTILRELPRLTVER